MKILPTTFADKMRLFCLTLVLICVSYVCNAQVLYYYSTYAPREGDIVFQSLPHNDLVDAIEGVTRSPYSHCGVVLLDANGHWVVIESIVDVHETPLLRWMIRGRKAGIAVYRLDDKYRSVIPEFKKHLLFDLGKPYDYDYEMSEKAIYCSELPYKAFLKTTGEPLGKLQKLGDLNWKPYEAFIRTVQGNKLPLDREMITPDGLSKAVQLKEVFRKGI